jgi:hypothetical protein
MSVEPAQKVILDNVAAELRADGFDVYVSPNAFLIPGFLKGFQPDAIALRDGKKIVVQIIQTNTAPEPRLERIRKLFEGQNDWELRIFWINKSNIPEGVHEVSTAAVRQTIGNLERLVKEGQFAPALLTGWATLEALGRALLPERFQRPQTPARLIEVLAGEGHVTPKEADQLRSLAKLRNTFIHGGLDISIDQEDLNRFVAILHTLSQAREPV